MCAVVMFRALRSWRIRSLLAAVHGFGYPANCWFSTAIARVHGS